MDRALSDFGLKQLVDKPTHIKSHILDWVVVRNDNNLLNFKAVATYPGLSDHFAVLGLISISRPAIVKRLVTSRNLRAVKKDDLKLDLVSLSSTFPNSDAPDLVSFYNDGLRQILDKHAPLRTRRVRHRPSAPWLSAEVRSARRRRRRAERAWRKTKQTVHMEIYVNARKETTQHILAAKKQYFANKIESTSFSAKQLFNVSNQLLGKSKSSTMPTNIPLYKLPEQFAQFFSYKIDSLREKLDSRPSVPPTFTVYKGPIFGNFVPVSDNEILDLLKRMPTKCCSLDPIPTDLVKECAENLVPHITCIINNSLATGIVPDKFKQAIVIPLLKNAGLDCNNLKNFRPVSNLPFVSKILEKVVLCQLQQHLNHNNLLEVNQSAYRKGHSVETATLSVMDNLLTKSDEKLISMIALLDLSAAFDTLDHAILLRRLEHSFGIRGNVLKWFTSYVSQRSQSVSVNESISNPRPLTYGVPQGSVLGPVLFTLYSQPLSDVISQFNCSFH